MICTTCHGIFRGSLPELVEYDEVPPQSVEKTHHATKKDLLKAVEERCQICTVLWRTISEKGSVEMAEQQVESSFTVYRFRGQYDMDTIAIDRSAYLCNVWFHSVCVINQAIAIFYLDPLRGLLYILFARSPELISIPPFRPSATRLIFRSTPTRHRGQHLIGCLLESSSEMDIDLCETSSEMYAPCQCGPPRLPSNSAARLTASFQ
jgi:hypothetical protein